jgi:hypothetical protein
MVIEFNAIVSPSGRFSNEDGIIIIRCVMNYLFPHSFFDDVRTRSLVKNELFFVPRTRKKIA